jgi:polysaccharide pyruvyl transferase WcaK-like protein
VADKVKILLPRVIYGNRGDILSRWGLINGLMLIGQDDIHVFAHKADDLPYEVRNQFHPYGKFHNMLLAGDSKKSLKRAQMILWSCGLDMTDESSMAKLLYLLATFSYYRLIHKEIRCVFQGIGPIKTARGATLSRKILRRVSRFIARDEKSYKLAQNLNPNLQVTLAGDAIFMPGFEAQIAQYAHAEVTERYIPGDGKPVIAVNIRRWFHFSSDLIPFQLAKKRYENRGQAQMQYLVGMYIALVGKLRKKYNARILLVSAYNPGVFSWEDDLPWLEKIKAAFSDEPEVQLMKEDLQMLDYLAVMSKVDLAVSMRLHSSLTVLRFGNPAVNISYAPKGVNSFHTLGLDDHAYEISRIMENADLLWEKVEQVMDNLDEEKKKVARGVEMVMATNMDALRAMFTGDHA